MKRPLTPPENWHSLPLDDLTATLGTDEAGLSSEEAARRLERHGPNEIAVVSIGSLFFDVVVDTAALQVSLFYMLAASIAVLGLFCWREGIDRPAAVVCLLLYLLTFFLV